MGIMPYSFQVWNATPLQYVTFKSFHILPQKINNINTRSVHFTILHLASSLRHIKVYHIPPMVSSTPPKTRHHFWLTILTYWHYFMALIIVMLSVTQVLLSKKRVFTSPFVLTLDVLPWRKKKIKYLQSIMTRSEMAFVGLSRRILC